MAPLQPPSGTLFLLRTQSQTPLVADKYGRSFEPLPNILQLTAPHPEFYLLFSPFILCVLTAELQCIALIVLSFSATTRYFSVGVDQGDYTSSLSSCISHSSQHAVPVI